MHLSDHSHMLCLSLSMSEVIISVCSYHVIYVCDFAHYVVR